ncbi:ribonuclease III family protein [Arabidopsis thaliana]|uniref:Ribonuclease III family protein n=1 Tax=Arabidopsis thaliana TaxID=3702 RepID=F4IN72_ARATH|nr:ribonuclease III family protein [Arabidopsis thaliana]AEC10942.1 ribonuclease III family protein [Arabidopsis thaliana]|eukprot:NP_001189778.1 ribonuclease III family protein [Arabidopsis thaliana]
MDVRSLTEEAAGICRTEDTEEVHDRYEHNRRLRNPATTAVQQAIHGLAYTIYGKPDVRRLMFEVFDFEQIQPKAV